MLIAELSSVECRELYMATRLESEDSVLSNSHRSGGDDVKRG